MTEEIKEKIKAYYVGDDINKVLDYITNLQEENKKLKIEKQEEYNRFNLMSKYRNKALARELMYKTRIDKATSIYLKELSEKGKVDDLACKMFNTLEENIK